MGIIPLNWPPSLKILTTHIKVGQKEGEFENSIPLPTQCSQEIPKNPDRVPTEAPTNINKISIRNNILYIK